MPGEMGRIPASSREVARVVTRDGLSAIIGGAMDEDIEHRAGAGARAPARSRPTPAALAERIAADPYGRWLGVELLELRPRYCRAALSLTLDMADFHGSPHGGAIFSLADFAFGGACNGYGHPAVALTVTIQFHAVARVGRRKRARRARDSAPGSTR